MKSPTIVFVCEHGAAKSVMATAYFNKLAAERGLPFRATFRGTAPQAELSVRTVNGLRAEGLPVPTGKPTAIGDDDVSRAYATVRDAIVQHVKRLLDELQTSP